MYQQLMLKEVPFGSDPIAIAYAGHQFGHFNPQLGDGRAHLLGEVIDQMGKRWDLQLKGSGPTSFSRGGDGRCAIGPAIREFIMSEAMKALGVPTTQCLAVVTTGEPVYRNTAVPGAVVTRVASSHLRVGTFQFFAARGDHNALHALRDYTIEHHFPELMAEKENRTILLMAKVIEKQIKLVVEWMRVGFIHGVMNTDNTAISGDTIDYGPCAMMGVYDPKTVYSSIDRMGRYAFGNQPTIAHWNMARLAECMLLLINKDDTQTIEQLKSMITEFTPQFNQAYNKMMGNKFGILSVRQEDEKLLDSLLAQFTLRSMDYTITFDLLTQSLTSNSVTSQMKTEFEQCFDPWRKRINEQDASIEEIQALMRQHNPVVIPRNHHIEAVIQECEETGVATSAEKFLEVLRCPYKEIPQTFQFQAPPDDGDQHYQTFCGT
ncbi:MAG: YdiU family protein [Pseudomonadales bacterium]